MSEGRNACYDMANKLLMFYMIQLPITIVTVLITIITSVNKIPNAEPLRSLLKAIMGSLAWGLVLQAHFVIVISIAVVVLAFSRLSVVSPLNSHQQ